MIVGTNQHKGSHSLLKRINRSVVLILLRRYKGLSRKELTQRTGLDGKTITNVTHDLLRMRMIKSVGKLARGVGRPREIIELNPAYGYALGIDLGASHIASVLVDFAGSIIARDQSKIHYGIRPGTIIERMISVGRSTLNQTKLNPKKVLGVGVCVPGTVDRIKGVGVWAANLAGWENVPLREAFEAAFQTQVECDESTRCAALGEWFARVEEDLNDFLLLDLSMGIGAALVQKGQVYYGHNGIAGEIGHTTVKPGGMRCRCGKRGCLEAEASGLAIAKKYGVWLKRKKPDIGNRNETISARDVVEGIRHGNEVCKRIFFEAARLLGTAAANAVMILDPAHLIVMGGLTRAGELLMKPFQAALKTELRTEILERLTVEISTLGDDAGPLGAASLILTRMYESPGIKMQIR